MNLDVQTTIAWIQKLNDKIQSNKDHLTSLDRAIGDGDHGINMARGFQEVSKVIEGAEFSSPSDVLKKVATTVMSKVGGASGPLYGTAFLKMSMANKEETVDGDGLAGMLEEALAGIKQRGKAEKGEKTMVDVWEPVVEAMNEEFDSGRLREVAQSSMEATEELKATKGRAAYLKDRSIGHLDPGSVSSFYLFEAMAEALEESE
ncbi:dihydroxyacetone kinase subunit L [Halobacillus fulvus]|nr:dihydroxyacetone kinase subunit L [Halobacillus fulvus]